MSDATVAYLDYFQQRPPSQAWEPIQIGEDPALIMWVWFKPHQLPHGITCRIPDELYSQHPEFISQVTIRHLLHCLRIPYEVFQCWSLAGGTYDSQLGQNPLLDHPLPAPSPELDPTVTLFLTIPVAAHPVANSPAEMPSALGANQPLTPQMEEVIDGMYKTWNASKQIEADLGRLRKSATDMAARVKALNRDMNPDEKRFSSSQDKKDWQDVRRWLRDCETRMSRIVKDHDIGFTSAAGQRTHFEEIYDKFIEPRLAFEGMEQKQREFEIYQKQLQNLTNEMNSSIQYAAQNGERRAQRLLAQIAAKVRAANTKKNFLGVVMD